MNGCRKNEGRRTMARLNNVALLGNLTKDPELRQTSQGTSVTDLRLAISDTTRDKDGEPVESTCYVDITAWEKQAEACAKYLTKGSPVLVEGKLQFDQWESKEGEKRSKLRVRAHRVQFLNNNHSESNDKTV